MGRKCKRKHAGSRAAQSKRKKVAKESAATALGRVKRLEGPGGGHPLESSSPSEAPSRDIGAQSFTQSFPETSATFDVFDKLQDQKISNVETRMESTIQASIQKLEKDIQSRLEDIKKCVDGLRGQHLYQLLAILCVFLGIVVAAYFGIASIIKDGDESVRRELSVQIENREAVRE